MDDFELFAEAVSIFMIGAYLLAAYEYEKRHAAKPLSDFNLPPR